MKKRSNPAYNGSISFSINPARRRERRDCAHYYGDTGCLAEAANEDLPAVPCKGCKLFEPASSEAPGEAIAPRPDLYH